VYENVTHNVLDSIRIKVFTTLEVTYTDKNGNFKIRAKVNDLLILSDFEYKTDTLLMTSMGF
jgi:hypothetical protein